MRQSPIASPVRMRPLAFGSRWQSQVSAYHRAPWRIASLAMNLVHRNWLFTIRREQRFGGNTFRWTIRLAAERRGQTPAAASMELHSRSSQTFVTHPSAVERNFSRSTVLASLLQVFRHESQTVIRRREGIAAAAMTPGNRSVEPEGRAAPARMNPALVHPIVKTAFARMRHVGQSASDSPPRQVVSQPALPASVSRAAGETDSAPRPAAQAPEARLPSQTMPAPVNLEHLTDQLMRQIDRRLVASRERNGRT